MGQGNGGLRRGRKNDDGNDDVKRQVDSDDNNQKTIYQLLNVKTGGGKLIEILKSSARMSSGSFGLNKSMELSVSQKQIETLVDKQIHDLVEPLLYNGGRGRWVSMARMWSSRYGAQEAAEVPEDPLLVSSDYNDIRFKNDSNFQWTCWKIEERGAVGETGLHICFLLSTQTHMILVRKLLSMFPMLINDIYLCDEYFGESSLHMAIVHENVRIAKLLLDYGANVHQRCLGSFFLPGDEKENANIQRKRTIDKLKRQLNDSNKIYEELLAFDLQSNDLFNASNSNYDGYCYWGEYPLSFAICLGLSDCYKLLLAKGANPNKQDSNGNTSLHMAVISDRIDMFDLCYSNGADLNIVNKQNLTPISLAAKLRRVKRQVTWIFCNVGFVENPLSGIDSINVKDGSYDENSVLSIVAFGGSTEHLEMLNGLLRRLLEIKWETSIQQKFYRWLLKFLIFLGLSFIAYVTRINERNNIEDDQISRNMYLNSSIKMYTELALVCFVIYYLWLIMQRIIPNSNLTESKNLSKAFSQAPEMFMFAFTCMLILLCIPIRFLKLKETEDFVAAIIMFTLPLKLLFFCRASRSVGSFVVMIYKIVVNDVLCFVVFLVIFVAGFSQSFLIIFKTHRRVNQFESDGSEVEVDIGKTYQDIASQPNENLRQWARALLFVEKIWSKGEKLNMLDKYSYMRLDESGSQNRYYCSTWPLNMTDIESLNALKKLNQENKYNSLRLTKLDRKPASSINQE